MFDKYLIQTQNEEVKTWITTVLKNYLSKNDENQGEVEHIIDYFDARKQWCDSRNKSFNLKKMSYPQAKKLSHDWVKKLSKQAKDIVETEADVETEIDFGNGVRLVKLVGQNAFKREGKLMSHCVASYYGKNDMSVYSLRDSLNNPHCTIEINNDNVNQIKGKGNGSIHPKYIKYILKVLKHFKKEVRKSELIHLGYRELTSETFTFYNNNVKNFKYMTYQGSNFMYVHQKFERKV